MRLALFVVLFITAQFVWGQAKESILLPNGWKLSPAGTSLPLGDLPLNMEISPSARYLAITNNGQGTQTIEMIDLQTWKKVDSIVVSKLWYGLQFTSDEKYLFASGGHDNVIVKFEVKNGKLKLVDSLVLGARWPNAIGPAGIALDESRHRLYTVTREDKRLYVLDTQTKKVINTFPLGGEGYSCKLSHKGDLLYITCWGCDKFLTFDLEKNSFRKPIPVGDNPNEIVITPNGRYAFVCNANDNTVSVIDLKSSAVIETLDAALFPDSPSGSTTNSVAYDEHFKRLYIANADNNCLAVFDFSKPGQSIPLGFIPTGWYPTCVRLVNGKIVVSNGKGFESKANPFGPSPVRGKEEVIHHGWSTKPGSEVQYIGSLMKGQLSVITVPSAPDLKAFSKQVYDNSPYTAYRRAQTSTLPPFPIGKNTTIKHVFYIIKENRTYDQVLSDVQGGNGDESLLLFGRPYTPNQHAIVDSFVLLDNFYVNAEVSADGHNWSMGAYANDYLEKTWPTSYGNRGGTYGGEGEREIANNKNGFIWNNCSRAGITYRTYGEFMEDDKPSLPILEGHNCGHYPGYNLEIRDTVRFGVWKKEFLNLIGQGAVPAFNTVRFGNDHTEGLRKGRPTPFAHIADNDLAVGLFVETLAQSPIWNESVVFVLEDDAQNGADHVDAHRSTIYVAGGLIKRKVVDHTMYTTASALHTMELLLGMEPMTQYDAGAPPMWSIFMDASVPSDFNAVVPNVNLSETNVVTNEWQKKSEKFSFAKEDSNDDIEFSSVLWHGIKGDTPFPGPTHAAFVIPSKTDED